jgi:hypothetical protein
MKSNNPLQLVSAADRDLLNLALSHNFDIYALVNKQQVNKERVNIDSNSHPACHTLIDLLVWFAQPHIAAAASFLVASFTAVDDLSQALTLKRIREGLEKTFTRAIQFAELLPCTDENAPLGNRQQRETRLLASAIKRLNPSKPSSRAQSAAPPQSTSDTATDVITDAVSRSSSPSHHTQPAATSSPESHFNLSLASLRQTVTSLHSPAPARPTSPPPSRSFSPSSISSLTLSAPPFDDLSDRLQRLNSSHSRPAAKILLSCGIPPATSTLHAEQKSKR